MKKVKLTGLLLFYFINIAYSQSLSPTVLSASGGYQESGGVSLSWTVGEPATATLQNGTIILTQGEQQPYIELRLLHLKAYLEGFYVGGGQMIAVLYNNDPMLYPANYCDSVTVELHASTTPFDLVVAENVILLTDGSAVVQFPNSLAFGSYYVVLRHRNSIETWSKTPLLFNGSAVTLDLTTY